MGPFKDFINGILNCYSVCGRQFGYRQFKKSHLLFDVAILHLEISSVDIFTQMEITYIEIFNAVMTVIRWVWKNLNILQQDTG